MIRIKAGSDETDVLAHQEQKDGLKNFKVQVEVNPRKKPYVTEMGKLLRWLKKTSVTEYIKEEWRPPCSTAKVESDGDILATFRTSTGWKIDDKDWYKEYQSQLKD